MPTASTPAPSWAADIPDAELLQRFAQETTEALKRSLPSTTQFRGAGTDGRVMWTGTGHGADGSLALSRTGYQFRAKLDLPGRKIAGLEIAPPPGTHPVNAAEYVAAEIIRRI